MYHPIDYCLHSRAELVILTWLGSLRWLNLQRTLRENLAPGIPDVHRTYTRMLIQCNFITRHKFSICGPMWYLIGQPVHKISNTNTKFLISYPYFSSHPCKASESMPSVPALPKGFYKTLWTIFSIISTRIKIGVSSYTYNVENGVFSRADVFLPRPPQKFYP